MAKKIALFFGGTSAEHEVSLLSAKNIVAAIDKKKYELYLIGIDKTGKWHYFSKIEDCFYVEDSKNPLAIRLNAGKCVTLDSQGHLLLTQTCQTLAKIDLLFPVIHGTLGEDGALAGLAKVFGLPCVGSDISASTLALNKHLTKMVLKTAGISVANEIYLRKQDTLTIDAFEHLGETLYIKPITQGSSFGVSCVKNPVELEEALKLAFTFDDAVIIEPEIKARELEIAVLGNADSELKISFPGEVVIADSFYSFEDKYITTDSQIVIPAKVDSQILLKLQTVAKQCFLALGCSGLARVDVFLDENNAIVVNEVNTMPGFTNTSMYPKLCEHIQIDYATLIDTLIALALQKESK